MKRFVLIDGNAILHRAFHALPPLTSKKGDLVNAVYGFFSMFLKIYTDLKPDYMTVCFDRPKPTFRQTLYVGYQAHRPKMDEDLVPQIEVVHKVLQKAKISIFEIDGYEADDLIGTLAAQTAKIDDRGLKVEDRRSIRPQASSLKNQSSTLYHPSSNIEVIIVSGDRDMLQLVNSHVKVLAPITGITNMLLYDEQKVEEKYGIKPKQMVDYKALVGDPSDNYPGVTGVGPKTATELLKRYGNFENLYQNIKDLPPKIAERLAIDTEQAALAKKLAQIVTDAPITLDIEKCATSRFDIEMTRRAFGELGFKSLLKRLPESFESKPEDPLIKKSKKNEQLGFI